MSLADEIRNYRNCANRGEKTFPFRAPIVTCSYQHGCEYKDKEQVGRNWVSVCKFDEAVLGALRE